MPKEASGAPTRSCRITALSVRICLLLFTLTLIVCNLGSHAQNRADRIERKVAAVKQKMEQWVKDGRNPSQAVILMQSAGKAFESGNPDKGESLVDQAEKVLAVVPVSTKPQGPVSNLYGNPELVNIVGLTHDAMEPFISLDGKYLFFNGSNEGDIPCHIFHAKRLPDGRFQYLGLLPGTTSAHRDMVPTMDARGNMYFTRFTDFAKTHKSVVVGQWHNERVTGVHYVEGNISDGIGPNPDFTGAVANMDCGISPDGTTLIISRAEIVANAPGPHISDLMLATRGPNGHFNVSPQSKTILAAINTPRLEYAPALTADGLELYFTRALNADQFALAENGSAGVFETMVARRTSTDKPFGTPIRLAAIEGYAEAPSLTLDKRELYFHKKDGNVFRIYRATRMN